MLILILLINIPLNIADSPARRRRSDVALRPRGGGGVTTSISRSPVAGLQVPRVVPGEAPDVSEVPLARRRAGAVEAGGRRNPVVRQSGGEVRLVMSRPTPNN